MVGGTKPTRMHHAVHLVPILHKEPDGSVLVCLVTQAVIGLK